MVKIPRFAFEKFPGVDDTLTISMKSVGETMAIGRTFKEALQKGFRGLEIGIHGYESIFKQTPDPERIEAMLTRPTPERLFYVKYAMEKGLSVEDIAKLTHIDPWFLHNIQEIVEMEKTLETYVGRTEIPRDVLQAAKRFGFSDIQLSDIIGISESEVRSFRIQKGITPVYKLVDTCAAEFEAYTPYFYSTYEKEDESRAGNAKKIMIIGGGPNRIGQGIEFDYCCVHASMALRELGKFQSRNGLHGL